MLCFLKSAHILSPLLYMSYVFPPFINSGSLGEIPQLLWYFFNGIPICLYIKSHRILSPWSYSIHLPPRPWSVEWGILFHCFLFYFSHLSTGILLLTLIILFPPSSQNHFFFMVDISYSLFVLVQYSYSYSTFIPIPFQFYFKPHSILFPYLIVLIALLCFTYILNFVPSLSLPRLYHNSLSILLLLLNNIPSLF